MANESHNPTPDELQNAEENLTPEEKKMSEARENLKSALDRMNEKAGRNERPGDKEYFTDVSQIFQEVGRLAESGQEGFIPIPDDPKSNQATFFWATLDEQRSWQDLDQMVKALSRDELRVELDMGNTQNQGAGIKIIKNKPQENQASNFDPRE